MEAGSTRPVLSCVVRKYRVKETHIDIIRDRAGRPENGSLAKAQLYFPQALL